MRSIAVLPLLVVATVVAFAQETDYTPRHANLTIFDEIDDPVEREAFRTAWNARETRAKRNLADAFVERYPRSMVLREAYELSARASAELGDQPAALERARLALRLLPENPSLLVMTADLAAKQSALDLADTSARDALRYLANADAPSPLTADAWRRIRDELRSTAYFVIGRVAALRGAYADARRSLLMSLSLNHEETEALYALGVVQTALGDDTGAAASFAHVMRTARTLAVPAREALQALYAKQPSGTAKSFDDYAASLTWTPPTPAVRASSPPAGPYAGSESCRECHAPIYERWRETGMSKMFRSYRAEDVIGDFSSGHTIANSARPVMQGGRHFIEIRRGDSSDWVRYPVDYLIGSKWQQAYATRLPDARILVFPVQYSRNRSAWLNYWAAVDGPGSPRTDITRFHTIPEGAIYQTSCAPCHTSQLTAKSGPESFAEFARTGQTAGPDRIAFREGGINCEMCHGPSRDHIDRIKSGVATRATYDTPVSFGRLPAAQYVAVCSQCHAQSAVHNANERGHVNYSDEVPFYRTYPMHLLSSFSRKAFYRDGRYRATTFISESFARSECFRTGNATCGSCHDPHPADAATNPTSLKFRDDPDRMCVQCHTGLGDRPERHTRHRAGTEGSRCVSCHMPRIMDALLFPARSHQIDDVPDAGMTARFGNADSPNACLDCHAERDEKWLKEEIGRFGGKVR